MITAGDFSTALYRLKEGPRLARERWRDPRHSRHGSFVELVADEFWRVKDLGRVTFTPTTDDMLATDWYVAA